MPSFLEWEPHTWALLYFISEWLIRVSMLFVVPRRRSPQAANAWLAFVFFLPWPGLILFWLIGSPKMPVWRRQVVVEYMEKMADVVARLERSPHSVRPTLAPELLPTTELASRLGHFQVVGGNHGELLTDYGATLRRLVADIDNAQDHVHLLFYIFAADAATAPVIDALGRAVQRGVRCRVLADALGSKAFLKALASRLEALGVQFHRMLPYGLLRWKLRVDLRNHRKIVVIDGKVGYAGSQNLVDAQFKEGIVYEELMARVEGPVVLQLQFVFAADWYLETRELLNDARCFPDPQALGNAPAQALPSGPTFPTENNQRLIVSLIHGSLKRVVITTPYLIPDDALLQALETAVLRGVDVHLVVSEKMDQLLVGLAQESYYGQLLDLGVKIHRYRKKFLHAKHASFDDKVVFVGSSNMDIRSFQLNGEISLLIYDEELALIQRTHQERYFQNATLLTPEAWAQRSRLRRMAQRVARLVSPLL